MFAGIADHEGEIPGATSAECGNYRDHDLPGARREAKVYLDEVLTRLDGKTTEYP